MAVTRLLRIRETKGSNPSAHLKKNIFYICNPEKTTGGLYIGGNAGISPEVIYTTFIRNKQNWGKQTNALQNCTQAFHYMLSFPPDCGVSEDLAYQITQEFCGQLLGDRFYYVFTVHNDKAHMHTHLTFDSVSKEDGYMFHSPQGDWERRIQPVADKICEKYRLPTLQYDPSGERRGKNYGAWEQDKAAEKNAAKWEAGETGPGRSTGVQKDCFPDCSLKAYASGKTYNWYDIIRDDIDEAILKSGSYEEFLFKLRQQRYVARDGKYLSLKPYGKEKAVRSGRLGTGYGKTEIQDRIRDKALAPQIQSRYKTYGDRDEMREIIFAKISRTPGFRMTPFQREFYRRWNNTFYIRKPGRRQTWKWKKDILEVQNLSDSIRYMLDYDIGSMEDLEKRQEELAAQREALGRKYNALRTRLYRAEPFYSLRQYEKTLRQYQADPSGQMSEKLDGTRKKVEGYCTLGEAREGYQELQAEIRECRRVMRDVRLEEKTAAQAKRVFYETEPYDAQNTVPFEQRKENPSPEPDRERDTQERSKAERR